MRKIAAHYLFCERLFSLHYVIIEDNTLLDIRPLQEEEAGVEFHNGLIWILPTTLPEKEYPWLKWLRDAPQQTIKDLLQQEATGTPPLLLSGEKVILFHFPDLTLTASELRTDYRSGNPYIQRL